MISAFGDDSHFNVSLIILPGAVTARSLDSVHKPRLMKKKNEKKKKKKKMKKNEKKRRRESQIGPQRHVSSSPFVFTKLVHDFQRSALTDIGA